MTAALILVLAVANSVSAEKGMMQQASLLQVQMKAEQLNAMSTVAELSTSDFVVSALGFQVGGAQLAYGASMISLLVIVSALYFHRGPLVIFRILSYLFALSTITLTIKNVYVNYHYSFPKFVTVLHFIASGGTAFAILAYRRIEHNKPIMSMGLKKQVFTVWPIALAFAMNIGSNNLALIYLSAGFVEMINSACPICVIAIVLASGKDFNFGLLRPVLMVCCGIAMCASGEMKFSLIGFSLAACATFLRALKNQLQHALMDDSDPNCEPMDPIQLLAWMSIPSLAIMLTWSLATEGAEPWIALAGPNSMGLNFALLISAVNAVILNVANLFVIKDLGALGMTLAGQLKGILIILGGVAMLGESVAFMQLFGFGIIVGGVYWYNQVEKAAKAKKAQEAKSSENSPLAK